MKMNRKFVEVYYEVKDVLDTFPEEFWSAQRMKRELQSRGIKERLANVKRIENVLWRFAKDQYVSVTYNIGSETSFRKYVDSKK